MIHKSLYFFPVCSLCPGIPEKGRSTTISYSTFNLHNLDEQDAHPTRLLTITIKQTRCGTAYQGSDSAFKIWVAMLRPYTDQRFRIIF
jgi:hypothetical protein